VQDVLRRGIDESSIAFGTEPAGQKKIERAPVTAPSEEQEGKPTRVLVVDDERDIASLFRARFRRELSRGELDFEFAFSGDDAMQVLGAGDHQFVLILSDVNMPGISGIDLVKRIRDLPSEVPVYMITAYGRSTEDAALEAGATGFLTKPLDFNAIRHLLS
jgi:two-component system, chemotaxis family, chemotaxis protein CheY